MRAQDLERRLSRLESRIRPVEDDNGWKLSQLRLLTTEELRRLERILEAIEAGEDMTQEDRAWLEEIDVRVGPGSLDEPMVSKANPPCDKS